MRLVLDESGASASEYALILMIVGGAMGIASIALGASVKSVMDVSTVGPNGTVYVCTANCQAEYVDYCAVVSHKNDVNPPVFSPSFPSGASCSGETPIS